jgi:hypothetical protein
MKSAAQAIMTLTKIGYRFELADGKLRYEHDGRTKPDPDIVIPLLKTIVANRDEAVMFLRIHCPQCGGAFYWGDKAGDLHCYGCDPWDRPTVH